MIFRTPIYLTPRVGWRDDALARRAIARRREQCDLRDSGAIGPNERWEQHGQGAQLHD
jgi:hypothetical protein